jgi:peptide/nickel transport system substrate-binding protein
MAGSTSTEDPTDTAHKKGICQMQHGRMTTRFLAFVLASAMLVVAGCGSKQAAPGGGNSNEAAGGGQPKKGGTITVGRPTDAISLDPQLATTAPEVWVYNNIFEPLVNLDEQMQVQPGLAEKWEWVNDTTLRFHLKTGVKFQDGTPFNAEAVKFTIERVINPKKPARGRSWLGPVTGAKVIDENTVDIITATPFAPLLNNLTMVFVAGIVSPTAVQKYGDDFGRNPVGTGPFKFQEWKTNDSITLARNDDYWGQKPNLDKVIFKVIPEEGARMIAFDRGDIDFLLHPAPSEMNRLKSDKQTNVVSTPGLRILYLGLNMQQAPTNDKLVRQALSHAIDMKAINEFVVEGQMLPAKGIVAPAIFGYKDVGLEAKYNFDVSKAAELLKQAGYTKGSDGIWQKGGKPLELSFWFSQGRDLKDKEIAEAVQDQLTKLGIKVKPYFREWAAHLTALAKEDPTFNLYTMGWVTMTGDSDFGIYSQFHSANAPPAGTQYNRYKNAEVDRLLDEARTSLDQAKRKAAYETAQELIVDDVVWLPVYQTQEVAVLKNYVKGYVGHPAEYYVRFNGVWLNK